jgi:hypothetical protein
VKGPEEIEKLSFGDITRKERERLCSRDVLDRCALALRAIESGREPDPGDLEAYLAWKKLFKDAVLTWFEEARKASEICRDAGRLRAGTDRQMRRGFMTPEEALRVRTENAEKIRLISGVYVSDLASFTDKVLELSGLEKDYYDYYKTGRGYHARSLNSNGGWNVIGCESFINQPILKYSNEIRSAVMIMHGDKAHSFYFGKDAYNNMITGSKYTDNKEFVVIEGAVHTDLYDGGSNNAIPFDKVQAFFEKYL